MSVITVQQSMGLLVSPVRSRSSLGLEKSIEKIVTSTGMTDAEARASLVKGNPQKRFVQTSEVAGTALWLCSPAAFSVNGHALSLSGGEI